MPAVNASLPATILFVEDEVLIAMVASTMISDLGYRVLQAHSGAQALKLLESNAVIDLIITDQSMPKMTGTELVRAAQALRPSLPALIATGHSELPEGFESVPRLGKPYDRDQLHREIEKLLVN
ncbi:response regulator [Roseococcus sp.]|uniref:response regulator n=1 Tax=Roseococcus sp. TaxID=2109646 RepID=UPI003BA8A2D5